MSGYVPMAPAGVGGSQSCARLSDVPRWNLILPNPCTTSAIRKALLDLRLAEKASELGHRTHNRGDDDEIDPLVDQYLRHWRGLIRKVLKGGWLTFSAVGTAQSPAWEIFASAPSVGPGSELLADVEAFFQRVDLERARIRGMSEVELDHFALTKGRVRRRLKMDLGSPLEPMTWRYRRRSLGTPAPAAVPLFGLGRVVTEPTPADDLDLPGWRSIPAPEEAPGSPSERSSGCPRPQQTSIHSPSKTWPPTRDSTGGWGIFSTGTELAPEALDHLRTIEELATRLYRCVFTDESELRFDLGNPEFWFRGFGPSWYAGGTHLGALASSKQRWAKVAIQLALDMIAVSDGRADRDRAASPIGRDRAGPSPSSDLLHIRRAGAWVASALGAPIRRRSCRSRSHHWSRGVGGHALARSIEVSIGERRPRVRVAGRRNRSTQPPTQCG